MSEVLAQLKKKGSSGGSTNAEVAANWDFSQYSGGGYTKTYSNGVIGDTYILVVTANYDMPDNFTVTGGTLVSTSAITGRRIYTVECTASTMSFYYYFAGLSTVPGTLIHLI